MRNNALVRLTLKASGQARRPAASVTIHATDSPSDNQGLPVASAVVGVGRKVRATMERLVAKARQYAIGQVSHRKDGDYKKTGPNKWVKIRDASDRGKGDTKSTETGQSTGADADVELPVQISDYSDKAIIVTGDTKSIVDALRELKEKLGMGGWNRKLKGWIFPKKFRDEVSQAITDYVLEQGTAAARPEPRKEEPTIDELRESANKEERHVHVPDAVEEGSPPTGDGQEPLNEAAARAMQYIDVRGKSTTQVKRGATARINELKELVKRTGLTNEDRQAARQEIDAIAYGMDYLRGEKDLASDALQDTGQEMRGAAKHTSRIDQYRKDKYLPFSRQALAEMEATDPGSVVKLLVRERQFSEARLEMAKEGFSAIGNTKGEPNVDAYAAFVAERGGTPGAAYIVSRMIANVSKKPEDSPEARAAYVDAATWFIRILNNWNTAEQAIGGIQELRKEFRTPSASAEDTDKAAAARSEMRAAKKRLTELVNARIGESKESMNPYSAAKIWNELEEATPEGKAYRKARREYIDIQKRVDAKANDDPSSVRNRLRALGPELIKAIGINEGGGRKESTNVANRVNRLVNTALEREASKDWSWAFRGGAGTGKKRKANDAHKKISAVDWRRFMIDKDTVDPTVRVGGKSVSFTSNKQLEDTFGLRGVQPGASLPVTERKEHTAHAGAALTDLANVLGVDEKDIGLNGRLGLGFASRKAADFMAVRAHYESGDFNINLTRYNGAGSLAHEWGHAMDNILAFVSAEGKGARSELLSRRDNQDAPGDGLPKGVTDAFFEVVNAMNEGDYVAHKDAQEFSPREGVRYHPSKYLDLKRQNAGGDSNKALAQLAEEYYAEAAKRAPVDPKAAKTFWKKRGISLNKQLKGAANYFAHTYNETVSLKMPEATPPMSRFAATAYSMGKYYGDRGEMFARAFESYVIDKLKEKGLRNGYLCGGDLKENPDKVPELLMQMGVYPPLGEETSLYPRGEERERVNAAFDKLFEQIRETKTLQKAALVLDGAAGKPSPLVRMILKGRLARTSAYVR